MNSKDNGRPGGLSSQATEPVPVSALRASIPDAAAIMLYDYYDAAERGVFATACDGRSERKLAWRLDELGLARWCGTNWGSHFFAITDAGKAWIDAEVADPTTRLAQAIEARRAETVQQGSVHESAVLEEDAP